MAVGHYLNIVIICVRANLIAHSKNKKACHVMNGLREKRLKPYANGI